MNHLNKLWQHNLFLLFSFIIAVNIFNLGCDNRVKGTYEQPSVTVSDCATDGLQASDCLAKSTTYWTDNLGANVAVLGGLTAVIPMGYQDGTNQCQVTDANLIASNIASGVSVLGVIGSGVFYGACIDNALNGAQCSTAGASRYVSTILGNNVSGADGSLSATIPAGYYDGTKSATMSDTDLAAGNIKSGTNIFGTTGTYTGTFQLNMASNALRDPGTAVLSNLTGQTTSLQLTLDQEQNTYAGAALPTTGGYNYRQIPDDTKDDEGYFGTNCKYAPRPSVDCGTGATLTAKIGHCITQNPTASTWNGATECNGGQGTWKLVSRNGANKEVWQDQRTGQIWSSQVSASINWCQASGVQTHVPVTYNQSYNNTGGTPIVGNGTIGAISGGSSSTLETITVTFTSATTFTVSNTDCGGGAITAGGLTTTPGSTVTWGRANYCSFTFTQGAINFAVNDSFRIESVNSSIFSCFPGGASGLQPASPISYCAEEAGVNAPAGETWGTGTYFAAKGSLGLNTTPSIRWRLPTKWDYLIAETNGIRFVMPDMGVAGVSRPNRDGSVGGASGDWTSTVYRTRYYSWYFDSTTGAYGAVQRSFGRAVRCIGR